MARIDTIRRAEMRSKQKNWKRNLERGLKTAPKVYIYYY